MNNLTHHCAQDVARDASSEEGGAKRETGGCGFEIERACWRLAMGSRTHVANIVRHHGVVRQESSEERGMQRKTDEQATEIDHAGWGLAKWSKSQVVTASRGRSRRTSTA